MANSFKTTPFARGQPHATCMVLCNDLYIMLQLKPFDTRCLGFTSYHLAPPWLHLAPKKMASTTRDSTTPIETEFNYFYEPDIYNPPGSCINEFKDVGELIDYIDVQTQDCYAERNDFEDSHTGKDGQLLDMVNMSIRNVYNEEVNLKIFD